MPLSVAQRRAMAVVPKITGSLSMAGSAHIIRDIIMSRSKRSSPFHRLLLAMSISDFSGSFWMAMSNWPIPADTPAVWDPRGNQASCTTQGFFLVLFVATPIYNASLAVYYYLVASRKWEDDRIRRVEPIMHAVPCIIGSVNAFIGLFKEQYNNANLWCWIAPYPLNCKDSYRYGEEGNCIRGDNAWIYRWALMYGPLWAAILVATVCMMAVFCSVLKKEREVDRFQTDGVAIRKRSWRVATQAFYYLMVFYISWVPATVLRCMQIFGRSPYALVIVFAVFTPMQGFLNFLVYTRSKYMKYRREHPRSTKTQALKVVTMGRSTVKKRSQKSGKSGEKPQSAGPVPIGSTIADDSTNMVTFKSEAYDPQERFRTEVLEHITEEQKKIGVLESEHQNEPSEDATHKGHIAEEQKKGDELESERQNGQTENALHVEEEEGVAEEEMNESQQEPVPQRPQEVTNDQVAALSETMP